MNRTNREKVFDFFWLVAVWTATDVWIVHTPLKWAIVKAVLIAIVIIAARDLLAPFMPRRKSGIITVGLDESTMGPALLKEHAAQDRDGTK